MLPTAATNVSAALGIYPEPFANLVRGEGARVWDDAGKEYIDLGGGVAVNCLGHANPLLRKALAGQADKLWHTSNLYANDVRTELCERLRELTFADRVYLCSSGAEANEAALKLARKRGLGRSPGKRKVVSFTGGFHGRYGFSLASSPNIGMGEGFGPPDGFEAARFNDIAETERMIDDDTCAVIVEPVQGEGGINIADARFLARLRELCDAHGALLVFDEIQCGNGRCGSLYRYMDVGVAPDVMTTAKGLGGGFPIGAMVAAEEASANLGVGDHGTTYGGNPMGCAVALAVLEEVAREEFLEGVRLRSRTFAERLDGINARLGCFEEIRVCGLLIGCDLKEGRVLDFLRTAAARGVLALKAGANALRLAPPLNIGDSEIEEGLARLEAALAEFSA